MRSTHDRGTLCLFRKREIRGNLFWLSAIMPLWHGRPSASKISIPRGKLRKLTNSFPRCFPIFGMAGVGEDESVSRDRRRRAPPRVAGRLQNHVRRSAPAGEAFLGGGAGECGNGVPNPASAAATLDPAALASSRAMPPDSRPFAVVVNTAPDEFLFIGSNGAPGLGSIRRALLA